jgi:spore germination cell wall hydrolase CwlJ-like protein
MTEITLDREQAQVEIPSSVLKGINALLMVLALAFSVFMLNWVVVDKLDKYTPVESSQITTAMRERQLSCLSRNIYYEAGNESFEGRVAVAQVTMNRVNSGQFPADVCKTIYQRNIFYEKVICQFSWTCSRDSGMRPPNTANYRESEEVAKKVLLEGFRLPSLDKALYYHASYISPGWKRKRIIQIGQHIFYE